MNREINRSELAKFIAEKEGIEQEIVDAFVNQLFIDVEKKMVDQSLVRLDNLGIFRIIKSGNINRILFLGTSRKDEIKPHVTTNPDQNVSASKENTPRNSGRIDTISPIRTSESKTESTNDNTPVEAPLAKKEIEDKVVSVKDTSLKDKVKAQETTTNVSSVPKTQIGSQESYTSRTPVYNRSRLNERVDKQSLSAKKISLTKKYKTVLRVAVALVIVAVLLAMFVKPQKKDTVEADSGMQKNNTEFNFSELKNPDSKNLSCVIVAQNSISVQELSAIYYGDEKFWPYIYKVNENIVVDNYIIPSQSIIKIPRITVDLVELNAGRLDEKLRSLADDITRD